MSGVRKFDPSKYNVDHSEYVMDRFESSSCGYISVSLVERTCRWWRYESRGL